MRLKLLCCEVLFREVCRLMADSPHTCDAEFLPKGLHDLGVEKMTPRLQERIDRVPEGSCDAIVLVYGLCNNGITALRSRHTRLVAPRAHDCITLFFGSRERYRQYFDAHPGTYYRTTGWMERNDDSGANDITVARKLGLFLRREELVRQYGEDNANYIMETMGDATANYSRLSFISMGLDCEERFCQAARKEAAEKGWEFEEIKGDMELLRKLIHGRWDDDFLVLDPGLTIRPCYDDSIIKAG